MLKKPPRVRDNNGALQIRVWLDGRDYFFNRLGRFDDPVAQARGQAIWLGQLLGCSTGKIGSFLLITTPLLDGYYNYMLRNIVLCD